MIHSKPRNPKPQHIKSNFLLSILNKTNNYAHFLSNTDDENEKDYIPNKGAKKVNNIKTCFGTYQNTQFVSTLDSQTAISNILVVFNSTLPPAITNLDFLKYPQ